MSNPHASVIGPPANWQLTNNQVERCLSIIGHLSGWLPKEDGTSLSEEIQNSLEGTIIRACNRLDHILDEPENWTVPKLDAQRLLSDRLVLLNTLLSHELFALEIRKQLALGNLTTKEEAAAETAPKQPGRKQRRRKQ
jgi:hypothetical protein